MADGYARASGGVGVAMATSARAATNMVTELRPRCSILAPVVCITGQVVSKFVGFGRISGDRHHGITMPITKHNVAYARAEELLRTVPEAFFDC